LQYFWQNFFRNILFFAAFLKTGDMSMSINYKKLLRQVRRHEMQSTDILKNNTLRMALKYG